MLVKLYIFSQVHTYLILYHTYSMNIYAFSRIPEVCLPVWKKNKNKIISFRSNNNLNKIEIIE